MKRLLPTFVTLLAVLIASPAIPTTYVILPDGTGDAPTIQAGIDSCSAGDTVLVTCGTYFEHDIFMKSGVCLRSESNNPTCATIDAQALGRCIRCVDMDSTTSIIGFTMTHGVGGIYCAGSSLKIANCHMVDNTTVVSSGKGGGLRCDFCTADVRSCTFENNSGTYGGGVYCAHYGPTFTSCHFLNNHATDEGGGIFLYVCDAPVDDCVFTGNTAGMGGGFATRWRVSPPITNCLFTENVADLGAAMSLESLCCPTIEHCTFAGNVASETSTLFLLSSSEPVVRSTIIASGSGDAWIGGDGACPTLLCCDIFGNEGGDWIGCIAGQFGVEGNFSADPLFCDPPTGDFTLRSDSPCLPGHHPDGSYCGVIGARPVGCPVTSAEDPTRRFETLYLAPGTPNPFRTSTRIVYAVLTGHAASHVQLQIHDATGRLIRTLVDAEQGAGTHETRWMGRNNLGQRAATGVYFCRLRRSGEVLTRPVILAR